MYKRQVVTRKNNFYKKYFHVLLAVVCATAFFVHESIPDKSEKYKEAYNKHHKEKQERTLLLNNFKNTYKDSPEYRSYYKQKVITDKAWEEFGEVKTNRLFLGFKDFQQFVGELGWALGLFLYALFNFINTFLEPNRGRKGKLFLHITLVTIALYFIYWALYNYQDFEKTTYFIFSLITSLVVAIGVYLIVGKRYKQKESYILNNQDLIGFILSNTKKESESEMWKILKKIKHERN